MVGRTERIRPTGQLRGVLGGVDQGQRQQGYDEEMKRARKGPSRLHRCNYKSIKLLIPDPVPVAGRGL